MARLELRLLGGFTTRVLPSGRALSVRRRKAQALLAYLALHPGHRLLRDHLTALLWGELEEEDARNNFRVTLFALRQELAHARVPALRADSEGVTLDPAAIDVDVPAFLRRVADGAQVGLAEAADLYRGEFLEGFRFQSTGFEEWLTRQREQLRASALGALHALAGKQLAAGATDDALATTLRLLSLDPLDEPAHRSVMRLHADSGRQIQALRQYQACVALLRRELDVAPSSDTRNLYRQILTRQESRVAGQSRARDEAGRPTPGARGVDVPLIGRLAEMSSLRKALDDTIRGHPRLAVVTGEAGVGKTRLVAELISEARPRGFRILLGRAYESEHALAYGPWLDAIRGAGLAGRDLGETGLAEVWRAELARLFPELGAPPPMVAGGDVNARLFEAVTALMSRLTSLDPVLLVLEDLHWADGLSSRLLSFLGRRLPSSGLMIIVTAREEELDGAEELRRALHELDRDSGILRVPVAALTEESTVALARALAGRRGSGPGFERVASAIWRTCRGNPFVVVETLNMLHEMSPGELPDTFPLPPRVREVITSRLARLSERGRELAAVVAVLGRPAPFSLVRQAAQLEGLEAAHAVEELVRRRVLHAVDDRLDFTHDRIRETAYEGIPGLRRRLLHEQAAAALEHCYAENLEPHLLAIAQHQREAESWERAVTTWRQAGTAATARGRLVDARSHLDEAIAGLDHLGETPDTLALAVDLRLDLRNVLFPLGEMAALHERLLEAERLATRLGDAERLGRSLDYLCNHLLITGFPRPGETFGDRARTIAETLGNDRLRVAVGYHLGAIYVNLAEHRKAEAALTAVAEDTAGELRGDLCGMAVLPSAAARCIVSYSLADQGRFREAMAKAQEGVTLARDLGHDFTLAQALLAVGYVCNQQGWFPEMVEALELGIAIARERKFWYIVPSLEGQLGHGYVRTQRVSEGLTMLARADAAITAMRVRGFEASVLVNRVRGLVFAERFDEAEARGLEALAVFQASGQRVHEAWMLFLLGETQASPARFDEKRARARYDAALAGAEACNLAPLAAHCEQGLAVLTRHAGRNEEAASRFAAAARKFRAMEMRF